MASVGENLPENLKCPICFELPDKKVYQCKDGHVICENCYNQLNECPTCRAPFGTEAIRNRLMEEMLDEKEFECLYKGSGCNKKMDRRAIRKHMQSCRYNPSKIASINICELIGFDTCAYRVSRGGVTEAIQHFQQEHNFIISDSSSFQLNLCDFSEVAASLKPVEIEGKGELETRERLWNPIVLNQIGRKERDSLLIITMANRKDASISWIPLQLSSDNHTINGVGTAQVEFIVGGDSYGDLIPLKWTIAAVDVFNADQILPNMYPFRIPASLLSKGCNDGGDLYVHCRIKSDDHHHRHHDRKKRSSEDQIIRVIYGLPDEIAAGQASAPPLPSSSNHKSRKHAKKNGIEKSPDGQNSKHSRKERKHSGKTLFPNVTCTTCQKPVEKELYKCLQCVDHMSCGRCLKKGEHKHLFATIKTPAQYEKLANKQEAVIKEVMDPQTWWNAVDELDQNSLNQKLQEFDRKCNNPECKEDRISFVCLECPMNTPVCRSCEKKDYHLEHVLAATTTLDRKNRFQRKFLFYHQQEREMRPFL